ncbi:hypothetical protein KQ874_00515 [Mycoplasma sp. ES3157-GEN-MYC]|uniref:Uncharacterized protein n=1 Tax=Mycoplasma miroungigenitalium TaxID=754515 RepID=A0A6M4J8I5_9MOLU|nr:hypothetical protein [Mycoplasma miroungigenitalium]MBU4690188.1 hypothetical protein [Mycoplasma miroungigenitalium]MBU4691459.1 hypothetical protein [Mycoplasma miroungigenitalium]QJR43294.1 hypothetical protein HLA87_00520 [Mycoplasma miroungigenitalium]
MNQANKKIIDLEYFVNLDQDELINSLKKYVEKVKIINATITHQQVSQTDYFRVKHNFDDVDDLLQDLVTIKAYIHVKETIKLHEELNAEFKQLLSKLCIDYTAKDTPDNQAFYKPENSSENVSIAWETSNVLLDDKFIIFVPKNAYKYAVITSNTTAHDLVVAPQKEIIEPTQEQESIVETEKAETETQNVEVVDTNGETEKMSNDDVVVEQENLESKVDIYETEELLIPYEQEIKATKYNAPSKNKFATILLIIAIIILLAFVVVIGLRLFEIITKTALF